MAKTLVDAASDATYVNRPAAEAVRRGLVATETASRVAETFSVLGDPTRVRIVHALSIGELCTFDLAAVLGMSESAVSHQLRLLRMLKLVKYRREGRVVYYALDDDHIRHLFEESLRHATEE